jgi:hypothetical protein
MIMMMNSNEAPPPPPLVLPGSAFFPSPQINDDDENHPYIWSEKEEDDDSDDNDDDDDTSSLSTISTTCEAAEDMVDFAVAFDYPCVVVYFLKKNNNYYNTLQPHHGACRSVNANHGVSPIVALLLLRKLEESPPVPQTIVVVHDDAVDQDANSLRDDDAWRANHCSYDSIPTFGVPDDIIDDKSPPPLPTFLVSPRSPHVVPGLKKRARITPLSSPSRPSSSALLTPPPPASNSSPIRAAA